MASRSRAPSSAAIIRASASGAGSPAPGGTPSGPGYGTSTIGGTQYIDLGSINANSTDNYTGYNVGGGAPVFYLPPGASSPVTNLTGQAVDQLPAGTQVLTPSSSASQVSSGPGTEHIGA